MSSLQRFRTCYRHRLHNRQKGFYSVYFLVPTKMGAFRPILDPLVLSGYFACKTFSMLSIKRLLEMVQPGDWLTTINLKDMRH